MMSNPRTRFLHSGFYFMCAIWPYGLGEVLASTLQPMIKRMVILIWLLGSFRYLSRNAKEDMSNLEAWNLLWPVFLSVIGVMLLPLALAYFEKLAIRGRRRKTTGDVKRRFCQILFDKDEVVQDWDRFFQAQKAVMVYITFSAIVTPVFFYYGPRLLIVYLAATLMFGILCTRKIRLPPGYRFGRAFNKLAQSDVYVPTIAFATFCLYIIICALILVYAPKRLPLEFIFVIIVGMRLQLGRGKKVAKSFLQDNPEWTGFWGVHEDSEDEEKINVDK